MAAKRAGLGPDRLLWLRACSEPEAAELLALARGFKPHVWMNAHSGMEALFMPYDHLPRIPAGSGAAATLQVGVPTAELSWLHRLCCGGWELVCLEPQDKRGKILRRGCAEASVELCDGNLLSHQVLCSTCDPYWPHMHSTSAASRDMSQKDLLKEWPDVHRCWSGSITCPAATAALWAPGANPWVRPAPLMQPGLPLLCCICCTLSRSMTLSADGAVMETLLRCLTLFELPYHPASHQDEVQQPPLYNTAPAPTRCIGVGMQRAITCPCRHACMRAGYLAHGTATDYMYERLKVPLSFTWEIYGDADAHFDDCFRMFNPVTRGAFDQVGPRLIWLPRKCQRCSLGSHAVSVLVTAILGKQPFLGHEFS